jgi:signal peptidase I
MSSAELIPAIPAPATTPVSKRRVIAAILSCFLPGSGEFFVGDYRRGATSFTFFAILVLLCWPGRVAGRFGGLVLIFAFFLVLSTASACTALFTKRSNYPRVSRKWLFLVIPMVYLGLNVSAFCAIRGTGFRAFQIPSNAMENTIVKGDSIIADMWAYRRQDPKRGDIVIFRREGLYLVKRVIAVGGDTVEGDVDHIVVNGTTLDEPYATFRSVRGDVAPFGPTKVATEELFVVGDSRDTSFDSRIPGFGNVERSAVVGRPLYVYRSRVKGRDGVRIH